MDRLKTLFVGLTYPNAAAHVGRDPDDRPAVVIEAWRAYGKSREANLIALASPEAARSLAASLLIAADEVEGAQR